MLNEKEIADKNAYNKLIDILEILRETGIEDRKFLQVMINLDEKLADKAMELIDLHGINNALRISRHSSKGEYPTEERPIAWGCRIPGGTGFLRIQDL